MDGTFEYCTKHFKQLFTIHAVKNNHYIPLVSAILPDKKQTTYLRMFEILVEECFLLDLTLEPEAVVVDLEIGIHWRFTSSWFIFPDFNFSLYGVEKYSIASKTISKSTTGHSIRSFQ